MRRYAVLLFSLEVILLLSETWSFVRVDYPRNGSTVIQRNFFPLAVQIDAHETVGAALLQYSIRSTTWTGNISVSSDGLVTSAAILNGTATENFEIEVKVRGYTVVWILFYVCVTSGSSVTSSIFGLPTYNASISEYSVEGHVVLPINVSIPYCDSSGIRLALNQSSKAFEIINQQLVVTNSSFLDYETRPRYKLIVVALDLEWMDSDFRQTGVTISVQDINDNAPVVQNSGASVNVSVRTHINTTLIWLNITDADTIANGLMTFSFIDGNINGTFGFDDASRSIILNKVFLQEATFNLTVRVNDGGTPYSQFSVAYFTIKSIRDQTEPMFVSSPYVFELAENLNRGGLIGTINAKTASGKAVTDITVLGFERAFSWSLRNLEITLGVLVPDFCQQSQYLLNATASVTGNKAWTNVVVLVVPVTKRLHFLQEQYNFTVFLNGTLRDVFSVQARDDRLDRTSIDLIMYELTDPSDYFSIDQYTGKGQLRVMPQIMSQAKFQMTVTAKTGTGELPYCQAMAMINIALVAVNKYSPSFLAVADGPIVVLESAPVNSTVYLINVTDPDIGKAGYVTIHQLSASADWLILSPSGNSLVLSRKLDYESGDRNITITLEAIDQGSPFQTSVTTLTFQVVDVNDNAPEFVRGNRSISQYDIQIYEDVKVGTVIANVSAVDADSGNNGLITYSMDHSADSMHFNINSKAGALSVLKLPARQVQERFHLIVTAMDHGIPSLNNTAQITVTSLEVNEYAPDIQTSSQNGILYLPENTTVGTVVLTLNITDDDYGEAGNVLVSLEDTSTSWFSLSKENDSVVLSKAVDYESDPHHVNITLTACDGGHPSLCSRYSLMVFLQDVNDNAPQFGPSFEIGSGAEWNSTLLSYYVYMWENASANSTVLFVFAQDLDSGENGQVKYMLSDIYDSSYFTIDETSGQVQLAVALNKQQKSEYRVKVTAEDGGNPPLSAEATILVELLEVNEYAPVILTSSPNGILYLSENTTVGAVVVTLNITDGDYGEAGSVLVSLVNASTSWFSLSKENDSVVLAKSVDYETDPHHVNITLTACDGGHPSLCRRYSLMVFLQDANDNAPQFGPSLGFGSKWNSSHLMYHVNMWENASANSTVLFVFAQDLDSGENGHVKYMLSDAHDSAYFTIDEVSGQVQLAVALNKQQRSEYRVRVTAKDGGSPPLSTKVTILVELLEVNDYQPTFNLSSDHTVVVDENTAVGAVILTISLDDRDLEQAGKVILDIVNSTVSWIMLNKTSGRLYVKNSPDFEENKSLGWILLEAKDQGVPPLTSRLNLTIQLRDVNEFKPMFNSTSYSKTINTILPSGETLVAVKATDQDGSGNVVTYSLKVNPSGLFAVNSTSGAIRSVAFVPEGRYTLTVTATDSGKPHQMSSVQVAITVFLSTVNAPQFTKQSYRIILVDGILAGSQVTQVTAIDLDNSVSLPVTYSLCCSPDFIVNSSSGEIQTNTTLNYTQKSRYSLILKASYHSSSDHLSSNTTVLILIAPSEASLHKPFHCAEPIADWVNTCSSDSMLSIKPDVVNVVRGINIQWDDWSTLSGGIDSFTYSIYMLMNASNSDLQYSPIPVFRHRSTQAGTQTLYTSFLNGGVYAVVLQVTNGNQSAWARRFMLIGHESKLLQVSTKPILFESAVFDGRVKWLTFNTGVSVSWYGHFGNSLFIKKPWLMNQVRKDPNIPDGYDQLIGHRPHDGKRTINGVIKFQLMFQIIGQRPEGAIRNAVEWPLGSPLNQNATIHTQLYSGDNVTVWITATDVFNNQFTDGSNLYVDLTAPALTNLNLIVMPGPLLQDFTGKPLSNNSPQAVFLHLSVEDCDSGVDYFEWKLGNNNSLSHYGFQTKMVENNGMNESHDCECLVLGECYQVRHVFQISEQVHELTAHNSNYRYSVLVVNHAGLNETHSGTGRTDWQFQEIDWTLSITSSTSLVAHWSNVTSGMTMAVEVCDAEVNVTDCQRMTEQPVYLSQARVSSLKKYRLYAAQLQLLDDLGAVVTLSPIKLNRTLQDSPDASPQNVHAIAVNSTAVEVTWDPPPQDKRNGIILYYVVYVTPIKREVNVSEQQQIITDLIAFTEYNINVAAFTAIGSSPKSTAVKVVTKQSGPAQPPTDVMITSITSRSLTVTWMPPPISFQNGLITGYDVMAARVGVNETLVRPLVVYTNGALKTLTGLIPYTNYSVSVRAINIAGKSEYSIAVNGETLEDRPGTPVIKEAMGQSTSGIRVLWIEPNETNGIILSYQIYLLGAGQSENRGKTYVVVDASERFYVFRKLSSSTTYYIQVRASTIMGFGNWSSNVSATTFTQLPGAPRNLAALATDKNITVMWDPPDNDSSYEYEITYGPVGGKSHKMGNIMGIRKVIMGLKPFTEYNFTIKVEVQDSPSSILLVWTLQSRPSAVKNFRVMPLFNQRSTFASVQLFWQEPEETNGIIGYKVQYTRIITQTTETVIVKPVISPYNRHDFTYVLPYLQGSNMYLFKMMAFNLKENFEGPRQLKNVETYPAVPTAPASVLATAMSRTEIDVIWQPPKHPNGIITRYEILYQPTMAAGNIMFSVQLKGDLVNSLQYTITGLQENTMYIISVVANNDFSSSQLSSQKEQKTLGPGDTQHAHVINVTVEEFAATVSWKLPPLNVFNVTTHYILNVSVYDQQLLKVINKEEIRLYFNSTKHHVTGLKPFTLYTFQIQFPLRSALDSPVVYRRTLVAAPSGAPRELGLVDELRTSDSLTFQWQPPSEDETNGVVLSYHVTFEHNKTVNSVLQPYYVLDKGVKPWTEYTIKVAAMTNGGIGPYANVTVRSREADPQITKFTIEPNNSTSINISFEIMTNGQLELLSLEYSYHEACQENSKLVNLMTEEMKTKRTVKKCLMLTKLEEATKYEIELFARNGEGHDSNEKITMTGEDRPSAPPDNLQCEVDNSIDGQVHLTWNDVPCLHKNGNITEYVVRYFSTWENIGVSPHFKTGIQGKGWTAHVPVVNATYRFEVAAKTQPGLGVFSPHCEVTIIAKSERVLEDGTWLGIIVTLILLVLLVVTYIAFWLRHHHLTGNFKLRGIELDYFTVTRFNPLYPQLDRIRREYPDYEIDRENIRRIKGLGEGNFGEVFLAIATSIIEDDIEMKVAVKSLKNGATKEMNEIFFEEMEIMMQYQHENIVRLLGVCTDKDPLYLVTEFMEQGDLKEFLVSKRATAPGEPDQLQFKDQCKILFQIACALTFLSDNNLVHRDVAARNCLVGTALIVKLADFGLARGTGSDLYYRKMGGAVPIRWMSPEAIFDGKYSVRSDVWSFGVLIWEVFMLGQMPFYGKSNEEVLEELKHGRHLELPDDCPQTVCDMMEFCWEQDAHKRITAGELVQLLNKLMSHSKTSSNVPLFSVAEFTSIIPSDQRQQENEYIPESLVSESYKSSQLPQCGSLFINRNVDEFSCMHENGDNINQSDLMQTIQDKKEEAFTTDEDLASRRPDDYKEANIGYLPRPYTNVDPFIRDEKDTGLTSAPEKFFTDLTMFDSEL